MKRLSLPITLFFIAFGITGFSGCAVNMEQKSTISGELKTHQFLNAMLLDSYFPKALVHEGADILRSLCVDIEQSKPKTNEELYVLTHAATEMFNELAQKFEQNGSEFETVAREVTAGEFELIARTYGFNANVEELIAPRDW